VRQTPNSARRSWTLLLLSSSRQWRVQSDVIISSILTHTQIEHDFVLNIAKKVTDARKKALEGAGQGIAKVCKNHA
jgi:hypothetical protein